MKNFILLLYFLSIVTFAPAQIAGFGDLTRYIENPSLVQENQLAPHVILIPFENPDQAKTAGWDNSGYYKSLCGTWKFRWMASPLEAPRGFEAAEFDAGEWDDIVVPGTWQMQGFGHYIYRNVPMEFSPYDPPHVPIDFNPAGFYIREFEAPASWKGRKTILHFDGVKAGFWVWINGIYTGFDKGSMTPSEFDISDYLVEGKNRIAVQVSRWTDGSYLEDQDMWRFAGIYRKVWLYSCPEINISDVFIITDLDENYKDAFLHVDCCVRNETNSDPGTMTVKAALYDPDGKNVAVFSHSLNGPGPCSTQKIEAGGKVRSPALWSAETPHLYTLVLSLENKSGKQVEIVEQKVGFRELVIKDAQLLVNGVPVTLKGVNRHEHDPVLGRTMTRETIEKDFKLMKEMNINAIRTCHYPNDPLFYDLADEWGFYICNEVNAECHYGQDYLASQPGWEAAFMDRTIRYVERDKNHPSVIMWSMGNECGLAPVHYKMAAWVRQADPTRFIYHQTNSPNGDAPFADICGTRYPNPAMLDAIGDTTTRPVILGEYAHAVGNSMGHFDDYWDRIYRFKSLQGGFIWDWVNQSLLVDFVTTPDSSVHRQQAVLMGRPGFIKGHKGQALQLSGLDDFIEVSPCASLNLTHDKLSLQSWIFPGRYNGSNTVISKGDAFSLGQDDKDSVSFYILTDKKYKISSYLPKNWSYNWHHLAGIYDGKNILLYVDGKLSASMTASGLIQRTRYEVTIGKNHQTDHENTPGFISNSAFDEVTIHSVALRQEELSFFLDEPAEKENLALWLPLDEKQQKGKFLCYGATPYTSATMDGVIFADRTMQPESWQVKHSHCPVKAEELDVKKGKFKISNRFSFTNLNEISLEWTLLKQGKPVDQGNKELDLEPLHDAEIVIPFDPEKTGDGADNIIRIEYRTKNDLPWAKAGYEIGFDEFEFSSGRKDLDEEMNSGGPALMISENGDDLLSLGSRFQLYLRQNQGRTEADRLRFRCLSF